MPILCGVVGLALREIVTSSKTCFRSMFRSHLILYMLWPPKVAPFSNRHVIYLLPVLHAIDAR